MRLGLSLLYLQYLLLIASCQRANQDPSAQPPLTRRQLLGRQLQQQPDYLKKVLQRYFSNEELEAHLQDYVGRCGDIAKLTSIGKTVGGLDILVLEISDRAGQEEAEPNVKYVGNVHGDEPTGRQLSLALAEWLCANYKTHAQAKRVVNDLHLFLLPSMNPDGFAEKARENKAGKDLNRDFPDRYSKSGMQPTGKEQPETAAVMQWSLQTSFVASASFHEGALLANYPWDGTPNRTTQYWACPDDDTFKHLARVYSKAHKRMWQSKEFPQGITNGAAWYPIYGSMQDWNYVVGGCYDITLELSGNKWPPEPSLEALWEDNKQALLQFGLSAALGGLRGTVKGQAAKLRAGMGQELRPLVANISVVGLDRVSRSRERFGDFYRPLAPGKYGVVVSADGFAPFSANVTVPEDGSGAALEAVLQPLGNAGGSGIGGNEGGGSTAAGEGAGSEGAAAAAAAAAGKEAAAGVGGGGAVVGAGGGGDAAAGRAMVRFGTRERAVLEESWWVKHGFMVGGVGALVLQLLWVRGRLKRRLQLGDRERVE